MRLPLRLLASAVVLGLTWCTLTSCSSLQGQAAPPITGGKLIVDGFPAPSAAIPEPRWRLLAFFSPN